MTIFDFLPHSRAEAVTDAIAVGSLTSPLWLHDLSGIAKDALPILAGTWIVVRIVVTLHTTYGKKK